jgi:prolyl-tRNA editing enzyme YbaK/EbsC (Cys-tRNA(Pro) deacylase)
MTEKPAEAVHPATAASTGNSVDRVRQKLTELGLQTEIRFFDASTRTAADAAAAIGCTLAQIAKSLVFRAKTTDQVVLVIASGSNRVNIGKIAAALGDEIGKADADFVRSRTGFAIGGVGPIGHSNACRIFIDRDLADYSEIWAAAGSPNAVFRLTPDELQRVTGGRVLDLKD